MRPNSLNAWARDRKEMLNLETPAQREARVLKENGVLDTEQVDVRIDAKGNAEYLNNDTIKVLV